MSTAAFWKHPRPHPTGAPRAVRGRPSRAESCDTHFERYRRLAPGWLPLVALPPPHDKCVNRGRKGEEPGDCGVSRRVYRKRNTT
jgi:hypothetical protein